MIVIDFAEKAKSRFKMVGILPKRMCIMEHIKVDSQLSDKNSDDIDRSIYELIQLISTLNDTRRSILNALAHIYPRSVSGVQLSRLIGYSGKSRSLYRGVLSHLQENTMILIDQLTPKLYAIRINPEHPLLQVLVDMCRKFGEQTRKIYERTLEE